MALFFGKNKNSSANADITETKDMTALELYIRGMQELIKSNSDTALVYLKESVKKDSDNVDAYIKVGDILREKGFASKATMIHYEVLLRDNLDFYLKKAALKSLIKDYKAMLDKSEEPAVNVRKVLINLSESVHSKEFFVEMYRAFLESKLYNIALEFVLKNKKMQGSVNLGVAYYLSAIEDINSSKFESALRKLSEAASTLKNIEEIDFYKGVCHYKTEDYTSAYKLLNKIVHLFPFFFRDYENILFKIGKYSEAGAVVSRMADSIEENVNLLFVCVDFKIRTSDSSGAVSLLKKFLKTKKDNSKFDNDYNAALLMLVRLLAKDNDGEFVKNAFAEFFSEKFDIVNISAREIECENCKEKIIENMRICPVCGKY